MPSKRTGKNTRKTNKIDMRDAYAEYYRNKRLVESGETFRSQKPSGYKRKTRRID